MSNIEEYKSLVDNVKEAEESLNEWHTCIMLPCIKMNTAQFSNMTKEQLLYLEYENQSIFSINEEPRNTYVLVLSPVSYPTNGSQEWLNLLRKIQSLGYEQGVNLVSGGGGIKRGYYDVQCARSRKYENKNNKLPSNGSVYGDRIKVSPIRRKKHPLKYQRGTNSGYSYKTYTEKPLNNSACCKFRFPIHLDDIRKCFYIKSGTGRNIHSNHMQKSIKEVMPLPTNASQIDKAIVRSISHTGASSLTVKTAVRANSGYLYSKYFTDNQTHTAILENFESLHTTADHLVSFLQLSPDIISCILYDDLNRPDLHTIRGKRRRQITMAINEFGNTTRTAPIEIDDEYDENNNNESGSHEISSIVNRLRVTSSGKLLLAVAWTTKKASLHFKKFPEVFSGDVVEGTNSEKRKLFIGVNYGPNNESNANTYIFMPSGRKWVFRYIAQSAIPLIHGTKVCKQIQTMIFDEDNNQLLPFFHASEVYPNIKIKVCWYHRSIQKVVPELKKHSDDEKSNQMIKTYLGLCNQLSDYCEDEKEYLLILNIIKVYINNQREKGIISQKLSELLLIQLESINSIKHWIAKYSFMGKRALAKRTTSSNEVRHRNLKHGCNRVKPQMGLKSSAERMIERNKVEDEIHLQEVAKMKNSTPLWNNLSLNITKRADEILYEQYLLSKKYKYVRENENEWYVLYDYDMQEHVHQNVYSIGLPRFRRVRKVIFSHQEGYKCSCCFYEDMGVVCRHILSIGIPITSGMVHMRYWNSYNFLYMREGTSNELNEYFQKLFDVNGVMAPNTDIESELPYSNGNQTYKEIIHKLRETKGPVIYNWDQEELKSAIELCSFPTFGFDGMSQDITNTLDDEQVDLTLSVQTDNIIDMSGNLYHQINTFAGDFSKYVNPNDIVFKEYLMKNFNSMLQQAISRSQNQITDDTLGLMQTKVDEANEIYLNRNKNQSDSEKTQSNYVSHLPNLDRRFQDQRIKSAHEKYN